MLKKASVTKTVPLAFDIWWKDWASYHKIKKLSTISVSVRESLHKHATTTYITGAGMERQLN